MPARAISTQTLIERSLIYPDGFLSPLEIEDAVTRALPRISAAPAT